MDGKQRIVKVRSVRKPQYVKIWNVLPDKVTNSFTLQVFRKRLNAFLMNNSVPMHYTP